MHFVRLNKLLTLHFQEVIIIYILELTILKVKAVEVVSFHQISQCLRLKGSQTGITNLPVAEKTEEWAKNLHTRQVMIPARPGEKNDLRVGLKVSIVDWLNQLLSDFDNFLFASWNRRSQDNHMVFLVYVSKQKASND